MLLNNVILGFLLLFVFPMLVGKLMYILSHLSMNEDMNMISRFIACWLLGFIVIIVINILIFILYVFLKFLNFIGLSFRGIVLHFQA